MKSAEWAYRPDIDGLRAVAITLVLVFHGASDRLPGGYIGVDVFFVISGFLITGIIVRRQETGRFRLSKFYAARIRRLYPALITVLLASLAAGFVIATTNEYRELGRETAASALFVANVYLWFTTDYFHQDGVYPLLHLWSLGVEEQFYFAWPVLLMLIAGLRTRLLSIAIIILVASLAYNIHLAQALPIAGFYSPFARAWELMAGAVLALTGWTIPARRWSTFMPIAGIGAIIATSILPDQLSIAGLPTIVTVAATMTIVASRESSMNRTLLSARPFILLGKISYPLYLWHWPLLAFLSIHQFGTAPPAYRVAALLLSVGLAYATYRWIEVEAVRRRVWMLSVAMIAIGVAGIWIARDGLPIRPVNADPRRAFVESFVARQHDEARLTRETRCDFYDFKDRFAKASIPADCTATDGKPVVLVWGDSHARALTPGIRQLLAGDSAGIFLATSACAPSISGGPPGQSAQAVACRRANAFAIKAIIRLRPRTLIVTQMQDQGQTDWVGIARWARTQGVGAVILIGSPPTWYPSLPSVIARYHWNDRQPYFAEGLFQPVLVSDAAVKRRLGQRSGVTYVSLIGSLCRNGACLARVPGAGARTIMIADYGHFTPEGSAYVAREIIGPVLARSEH